MDYNALIAQKVAEKGQSLSTFSQRKLEIELRRHYARTDLYFLTKYVLGYDLLTDGYHKPLCDTLTYYHDREQLHLHPRGHFKSTIITISENIQDILNNPNITILIVNAVLDKAKAFLKEIRAHFMHNPVLKELFPEFCPEKDEGTQEKFTSPARTSYWIREPTVEVTGIDKAVVSAHYDKIVFDDIVNGLNVRTPEYRKKVGDAYREYLSLINPPGLLRIVGTRWHYYDIYGEILEEITTAKEDVDTGDGLGLDNAELSRCLIFKTSVFKEDGTPAFPERFNDKYVAWLKKKQGPYIFSCQYMNDPQPDEEKIFDTNDLRYTESPIVPKDTQLFKFCAIDPSVSSTAQSDPAVIVTIAVNCNGDIFITDIRREWWNPDQLINSVLDIAKDTNPLRFGFESVAFQKTLYHFLDKEMRRRGLYLRIEEIKRSSKIHKEDRIRRIQPFLKEGKIFLCDNPTSLRPTSKQLLQEFQEFPFGRYDDCLDALADCIELMQTPAKAPRVTVEYVPNDPSQPYRAGRGYRKVFRRVS